MFSVNLRLSLLPLLGFGLMTLNSAHSATELVVATVNNSHMLTLQKMSVGFERTHPDIRLKWITLEEGLLRQQVTQDVLTGANRFDVVTIGPYETLLWGQMGRLRPLTPGTDYDVADLIPSVKQSVTVNGQLFALPFYGESSMTMVRSDLLQAAGITLPATPTWNQIAQAARKLHAPDKGVYGICLRGKAGWGENVALVTTMVNTYGGQWFDMKWQPLLNTPAWHQAVGMYAQLLRNYGPPDAAANGYNENLTLFSEGRCAIWVDATIAGMSVSDKALSKVAGRVSFLQAPTAVTPKGSHWLWTWALAVPKGSSKPDPAQQFVEWATSKQYRAAAAQTHGWLNVPSGVRLSTYAETAYRAMAPHAEVERQALASVNPTDSTLNKAPYVGVQMVSIPEFQAIGTAIGRELSTLLQGSAKVEDVLNKCQALVTQKAVTPLKSPAN